MASTPEAAAPLDAHLSDEQRRIVREIRRIADKLASKTLSQSQFDEHHQLGGVTTAGLQFGSWNEAIVAAGLEPIPAHAGAVPQYTDRELLEDILRVHEELGDEPSERKMSARSRYSLKPYKDRWGSLAKAREAAYALLGRPGPRAR